ncbi:MAG: 2-hydroxyacyl-CoA dehydratase, partial [Deltaproteobacteria bacterium]|nr:2-hydroxyacyl-CoA dehydratase [Deltaproteobacteria bacterium]
PDIAASVFHAVALQALNTLARGFEPKPKIIFSGGPLTFLPMLRNILAMKMKIDDKDILIPPHPELFTATGAAILQSPKPYTVSISKFLDRLESDRPGISISNNREHPLFENNNAFLSWKKTRFVHVERVGLSELENSDCYIGIDSGSTTTKMVMIDGQGRIALDYYAYNKGDHITAVKKGLGYFSDKMRLSGVQPRIIGTGATGYGEDFIRNVFDLDMGIVETLAHYRAARHLTWDVSFILDIGGQDMKAMFTENGFIRKIEINEACSSGCGTFLQTFAEILNCSVEKFAEQACSSESPCDLGSRCTVFMNSRVKQALREGAPLEDMAAGLAYSVVRNCLNKVLKIKDMSELGEKVVLQGGTFLNPSVQRAFEILTGAEVYCPDIAGLMGAYGCALGVKDHFLKTGSSSRSPVDIDKLVMIGDCRKDSIHCKGCSNQCIVTKFQFDKGRTFYSGNRCERIFSNGGQSAYKGFNLVEFKEDLLFNRELIPRESPRLTIGIPRALNMYDNFPFWCSLFVDLGFEVKLSSPSNIKLYEKGTGTIMSDSICFPAKLVHGHIIDLMEKQVDRIFFPMVVYENPEQNAFNSYNCPIVTGYPAVIKSAVNPEKRMGIPLDTPTISFKDISLLKKSCFEYFKPFGIGRRAFNRALDRAFKTHMEFKQSLRSKANEIIERASFEGRQVIMVADRPYHMDKLINHGVYEMLSQMGMDVVTADSAPPSSGKIADVAALTQWEYTNRIYNSGNYANHLENVELVQINSFGCGLDSIAMDVLPEIMKTSGKNVTLVRVDEITSPGSIKLRLRTLVESLSLRSRMPPKKAVKLNTLPVFTHRDKGREILFPYFSKFYSPLIESTFKETGYNINILPPPDKTSVDIGLKYTNNEICYPAIIVVGDIIKALQSGRYDLSNVAVGISQTGAQCRASNYVTMIKRGLLGAGYKVPVVTVHLKSSIMNDQPGFKFNRIRLIKSGLYALTFVDSLSMMYHPLPVREKIPGNAWNIVQKYLDLWEKDMEKDGTDKLCLLLEKAVEDFNGIPVKDGAFPRIGLVGEIYAKYNDFCNQNVVKWLTNMGVEVEVPGMMNFFTQGLVNFQVDIEKHIEKKSILKPLSSYFGKKLNNFFTRINGILAKYRYYHPIPDIREIAEKAARVMDLTNQFGEGWLIPGEVLKMLENGIENIVCLQPFGCIANQVIAKGIEKSMKDLYPNLNILFLDLDANTSEANIFNRLHFLVKSAKVSLDLS